MVDTYNIVWYDFEDMNWQDWTRCDMTAQVDTFFHVDDFDGLEGGAYGLLVPISGSKSIWCGARPGTDEYMYWWLYAPGYGNNWDQHLLTSEIHFDGALTLSYHGIFDSEEDYDYTRIEYDAGGGEWVEVHGWDGRGVDTIVTHEILTSQTSTKLRFHFTSDGVWSDQDGRGNTDGACIIDDIVISDGTGVIDTEDFEDWEVGATSDPGSIWHAIPEEGYGMYSGLWTGLQDKDPCNYNFGTQIVFFVGSQYPSIEYPGLFDTPFCAPFPLCQYERVVSPVIDLTKYSTGNDEVQDGDIPTDKLADLDGAILKFTVYRDLPDDNCYYYVWHIRIVYESGAPGLWWSYNYVYNGGDREYIFEAFEIGEMIAPTQKLQVALSVIDYSGALGPIATEHTPSPWFDNVRIVRYGTAGPQWLHRSLDLFQDNFPEDEFDVESFVRADAADDKALPTDPFFRPGDSIVVTCASPLGGGIREGGVTGSGEVYMHVRCTDISGWLGKPNLYGAQLEGSCGSYVSDDGTEWTIIQCDTAKTGWNNPVPDQWCVDLNDSLFTRGYMAEYYFSAVDNTGDVTTLPKGGGGPGAGASLSSGPTKMFEFTCLPTGRSNILYVDDFDGRGCHEGIVQIYFDNTFRLVPSGNIKGPDRYDVNAPSSMVGNGLASRATLNQILYDDIERSGYTIIIWDSGDLDVGTIGDGNPTIEKTDDCSLLINWLNQSGNDVGLWISGDNIAYDLSQNLGSPQAIMLMSSWCGVIHDAGSYFDLTGSWIAGGVLNPLVTGDSTGIFWNSGDPHQFYLDGGCPTIDNFDILSTTAYGDEALAYPDYDGETYAAGIQSSQTNSTYNTARTMWLGFSFMNIRDVVADGTIVRVDICSNILEWFNGSALPCCPTDDEIPGVYRLAQNFPNPFNPTTAIRFDIKRKGQVSLRIYNVAGQLVRTLVDGELEAGNYSKEWKGLNNSGSKVASGVYFYRLEAGEFESVKKMVLLQ